MAITSAIVLFAVIWFLALFVILPIRRRTQGDEDKVVHGTQAGAPANFDVKRTMIIVTALAFVIWAVITAIILSGAISVRDMDWFDRMTG